MTRHESSAHPLVYEQVYGMTMVRLQETRYVDRPLDEVFDYVADFDNIEDWDPGVEASKRQGDTVGPGTKFDLEVRFGSGTAPMVYEIT